MLAIILIVAGILLRFAPHAPNFTPVAAIALFGGAYLNRKYALMVPLALMIISDLFLGLHNVVIFTWSGFLLIAALGFLIKRQKSILKILSLSLASSFLFYLITNFGVWLMGWYPPTLSGLISSYIMALPFLRNFTLATILYSLSLFGVYELVSRLVKDKKLSKVLLTN